MVGEDGRWVEFALDFGNYINIFIGKICVVFMGLFRKIFLEEVASSRKVRCEVVDTPVDAVVQSWTDGSSTVVCPNRNYYGGLTYCKIPPKDLAGAGRVGCYACPYVHRKQGVF